MLGKSNLNFQRQFFVRDLYNPLDFLNNFGIVEFENVTSFFNAIKDDYYKPRGDLIIHVFSTESFDDLKTIILESGICEKCNLFLHIHEEKCFDHMDKISKKRLALIINEGTSIDWSRNKSLIKFITKNPIFMEVSINFHNIDVVFENIIDWYVKGNTRLFDLKIDFESFEKAALGDLHRIFFRFSRLMSWKGVTKDMKQGFKMGFKIYPDLFNKRIFVSEDYKLYYNKRHFKEKRVPPLFTLQRDKTGEDIPFQELNSIRQYVDLDRRMMVIDNKQNLNWIDFYQNFLIQGVINEVPVIVELVHRWLQ